MLVAIINGQDPTTAATPTNTSIDAVSVLISTSKTNDTDKHSSIKINCAKECPCGVPTIPVPDQWLEVMVSGGFKVWHIIFIIIALIITIVVVYCCFHRCRIPRTKQEIEADLMRSNMTNKFRDYLQELPNEPVTFIEVLKRVIDMEEKLEKDDALPSRDVGMRKRMGWLKLKGKNTPPQQNADVEAGNQEPPVDESIAPGSVLDVFNSDKGQVQPTTATTPDRSDANQTNKNLSEKAPKQSKTDDQAEAEQRSPNPQQTSTQKSTLDVDVATKLAKEQHRAKHDDLRKKRSPAVGSNRLINSTNNANTSPSQTSDDKHQVRRRKHNKPNLSRSKMIREKTHPSFDVGAGIASAPSDEKLNLHVPIHEQTQVTFDDPIVDMDTNKTLKDKQIKKTKTKKQSTTKPVKTNRTARKVPVRDNSINKRKDL